MATNEKSRKINLIIIFLIVFIIGIAAGFAYGWFAGGRDNPTTETTTQTESSSQSTSETSSAAPTTESTTDAEGTTAEQTTTTTKNADNDYDLPLSINTALDALQDHYGPGFEINSTVEEGGLNYFSVYRIDEKYASVAVNLNTGDATETRMSDGRKMNFSLVK